MGDYPTCLQFIHFDFSFYNSYEINAKMFMLSIYQYPEIISKTMKHQGFPTLIKYKYHVLSQYFPTQFELPPSHDGEYEPYDSINSSNNNFDSSLSSITKKVESSNLSRISFANQLGIQEGQNQKMIEVQKIHGSELVKPKKLKEQPPSQILAPFRKNQMSVVHQASTQKERSGSKNAEFPEQPSAENQLKSDILDDDDDNLFSNRHKQQVSKLNMPMSLKQFQTKLNQITNSEHKESSKLPRQNLGKYQTQYLEEFQKHFGKRQRQLQERLKQIRENQKNIQKIEEKEKKKPFLDEKVFQEDMESDEDLEGIETDTPLKMKTQKSHQDQTNKLSEKVQKHDYIISSILQKLDALNSQNQTLRAHIQGLQHENQQLKEYIKVETQELKEADQKHNAEIQKMSKDIETLKLQNKTLKEADTVKNKKLEQYDKASTKIQDCILMVRGFDHKLWELGQQKFQELIGDGKYENLQTNIKGKYAQESLAQKTENEIKSPQETCVQLGSEVQKVQAADNEIKSPQETCVQLGSEVQKVQAADNEIKSPQETCVQGASEFQDVQAVDSEVKNNQGKISFGVKAQEAQAKLVNFQAINVQATHKKVKNIEGMKTKVTKSLIESKEVHVEKSQRLNITEQKYRKNYNYIDNQDSEGQGDEEQCNEGYDQEIDRQYENDEYDDRQYENDEYDDRQYENDEYDDRQYDQENGYYDGEGGYDRLDPDYEGSEDSYY